MFLPESGLSSVNHQTLLWPWMAPIVAMDGSYCGHGWLLLWPWMAPIVAMDGSSNRNNKAFMVKM